MAYPRPFSHDGFPEITTEAPQEPSEDKESGKNKVSYAGVLRKKAPPRALSRALWFQEKGKPTNCSQSFQTVEKEQNPEINQKKNFCCIPGVDDVEIRFMVENPAKCSKVRFELHSSLWAYGPIWILEKEGEAAVELLSKEEPSIEFKEMKVEDDKFPDKIPTLEHAPYQLRMIVTDTETKGTSVAWTYFDILVEKLELFYGEEGLIPEGTIADTLSDFKDRVDKAEKEVLKALKKGEAGLAEVPTRGQVDIELKGAIGGYHHYSEWNSWRDMAYHRFRWLWGQGPRLPLVARVYLRSVA